jgi:hypothetical protein
MTRKGQALSVLIVSTLAFTVCFMVWMMFGVIGIPIKKDARPQFHAVWFADVHAGADRFADPRALWASGLTVWWSHRHGRADGKHRACHLDDESYATEFWHFLTIGLFVGLAGGSFSVGTPYVARWFPKTTGFCHGHLWRGQLRLRRQQISGTRSGGGFWLDHGAAGLRRHHAGHLDFVLAVQLQRPGAPGAQPRSLFETSSRR